MKEEINKLKGYASSNKLDRDFVLLYRSILREGNSDEVKEVYNLVVALSKSNDPNTNRFSYHALEDYKKIIRVKLNYDMLKKAVSEYDGLEESQIYINYLYKKIIELESKYFLRKANEIMGPFLKNNSSINIEIKEVEPKKSDNLISFNNTYKEVIEEAIQNLNSQIYSEEKVNEILEKLSLLEMKKDELKNELSQDEYRNYSMEIKEIMGRFYNIKDAIEEENEIWRSY